MATAFRTHGRRRRRMLVLAVLLATVSLAIAQLGSALAATGTFYLKGNGIPEASLTVAAPTAGSLPNHDPGRDDDPGLQIAKGGSGVDETDPAKHQLWVAPPAAMEIDGEVRFTYWSAMKDFATDKKGVVRAYLLDCTPAGNDCELIASRQQVSNPWSDEATWTAKTIVFNEIEHTIAPGRSLALKLMVMGNSQDDMWFAYDTAEFPSALSLELDSPPPTTTTTTAPPPPTTTTTIAPPPPTTTTTTAPPPTTTTTTAPPPPTTTTTTAPPPPTTTTTTTTTTPPTATTQPPPVAPTTTTTPPIGPPGPQVSTTSTTVPPPTTIPDQPDQELIAAPVTLPPDEPGDTDPELSALPESAGGHTGFSGVLLDGLEVVIPPTVATSLLSPLLLLESIAMAFVRTGLELLVPGLLLMLVVLWGDDRRRKRSVLLEPESTA